jgi:hypothetical protein
VVHSLFELSTLLWFVVHSDFTIAPGKIDPLYYCVYHTTIPETRRNKTRGPSSLDRCARLFQSIILEHYDLCLSRLLCPSAKLGTNLLIYGMRTLGFDTSDICNTVNQEKSETTQRSPQNFPHICGDKKYVFWRAPLCLCYHTFLCTI